MKKLLELSDQPLPFFGCLRLGSCLYCVKCANKRLKYCSFLFMFNLHLTVIDAIKQPRIL